jgi:CDP-diacylglycerol pyrophosphatase
MKIFELKKSRFFHQSWENRFLLTTKSPNKIRSADLKSALNFEFNYVSHYIWF